jgi:hypothetical protein
LGHIGARRLSVHQTGKIRKEIDFLKEAIKKQGEDGIICSKP